MYLIDKPFISDFLIKTIKENKHKIIATKIAKELIDDNSLEWVSENDAIAEISINPDMPLYSNSENALSWIEQNFGESSMAKSINLLKNKFKFRELIKDIFPGFYFKKISLDEIQNNPSENLIFPFGSDPDPGPTLQDPPPRPLRA